jgi:hypothetical protein
MTPVAGRLAGRVFLNNRYHDPTLGRFISVDPLVNVTHDAYGYGHNNPTRYSDPTGLEPGCGLTASSATSCREAHQQEDAVVEAWLGDDNASPAQTGAAVRGTKRGKVVGSVIDVAHQGNWDKIDGNWSWDDVGDAAAGRNLLGLTGDAAAAAVVQSVARRLLAYRDIWESLDIDRSWWDRHKKLLVPIATLILDVVAVVGVSRVKVFETGVSWA